MQIRIVSRVILCVLLLASLVSPVKVEAGKTPKSLVKIGVLATLTGSGFSLGRNTVAALQIAAADIQNIHPQYNPVRYRFLIRDTQHDPSLALNAIQDLHARGVKIIIGPQTSSEVAMIKPFADAHDMLVISQGSTASSLAIPGDNILRFCPNDRREAEALVALLQHDGIRAIVPLWRNDAGNNGLHDSVKIRFQALGGRVTSGFRYETNTSNFSAATNAVASQIGTLIGSGINPSAVAVYLAAFDEAVDIFHSAEANSTLANTAWYGSDGVALSAALTGDSNAAGFALSAYDALFVVNLALQRPKPLKNFDRFKAEFIEEAEHYRGVTGSTALDAAGDRETGDFDFWAVRLRNGSYKWVRVATYSNGMLTVF